MREIKFRFWNAQGLRFHYDQRQVLSCLTNQICGGYDYTKDDCAFEQFTGLRDKNGREIYDGDIVKAWIDFGPGGEGLEIYEVIIGLHGTSLQPWTFEEPGFLPEVIGNIHENPELVAKA